MQQLEVNFAVRPIEWPLGVKWLIGYWRIPPVVKMAVAWRS